MTYIEPESNRQLMKEAKIALPIVGLLALGFLFSAYWRISGWASGTSIDMSERYDSSSRFDTDEVTPQARSEVNVASTPPRDQANALRSSSSADSVVPSRTPVLQASTTTHRDHSERASPNQMTRPRGNGSGYQLASTNRDTESGMQRRPNNASPDLRDPNRHSTRGPGDSTDERSSESTYSQHTMTSQNTTTSQNTLASQNTLTSPNMLPTRSDSLSPNTSDESGRAVGIQLELSADDSYWSISERAYGNGQYFRALHAWLNLRGDTAPFRDGAVLSLPRVDQLVAAHRELCPDISGSTPQLSSSDTQSLTTTGQETLFGVAAEYLGQASRYDEVLALNRERLPSTIRPGDRLPRGVELRLPR